MDRLATEQAIRVAMLWWAVSFLGACTSSQSLNASTLSYQNLDLSKNQSAAFRRDFLECRQDYPETASGVHIRQWQGCMSMKGWRNP